MNFPTLELLAQWRARNNHLKFIQHCWQRQDPFIIGNHTREICKLIDVALDRYNKGVSTYCMIECPFRHGKSDILSRFLPPHFLGEHPDREVLLASYGADLSEEFSKYGRRIMRCDSFKSLYPKVELAHDEQRMDLWGIEGNIGRAQFVGLGGAVTGKGGDLLLMDDYCKSREQAESETYRNKTWDSFTNDLMTRRAPVCIVIILVTPWHVDDIVGRIKREMAKNPAFPHFEEYKFPAKSDKYKSGYLFPERFTPQWYDEQAATLGQYCASALLQCEPSVRGGNILKTDRIKVVGADEWYAKCNQFRWVRGWDLASSEKQRMGDDPDYTVGIKLSVQFVSRGDNKQPILFIDDVKRGRWEAGQRNQIIRETAMLDGDGVQIGIEAFAAYKDAWTQIKDVLAGIRSVNRVNLPGDKVSKVMRVEPIFEVGNVYIKAADWNNDFIRECSEFPSGAHDDIPDSMVVAYSMFQQNVTFGHI